jgi:hypothetical protein
VLYFGSLTLLYLQVSQDGNGVIQYASFIRFLTHIQQTLGSTVHEVMNSMQTEVNKNGDPKHHGEETTVSLKSTYYVSSGTNLSEKRTDPILRVED